MTLLDTFLAQSAKLHEHLCPRQVLGVRMGMFGGQLLRLELPQTAKRLLTIMETDGCGADGVSVATNCWVGKRTMRIEDYGKMAATFVDTQTETAVRITPHPRCRETAVRYAPEANNKWESYLLGYQRMPTNELLVQQTVKLAQPVGEIISKPSVRAICAKCGEEIINQREVMHSNLILCKGCLGGAYYVPCSQQSTS